MSAPFVVRSCHFDFHAPIERATYDAALEVAKQRGFEATIRCGDTLVASWSPLYGTKVYDRSLASLQR